MRKAIGNKPSDAFLNIALSNTLSMKLLISIIISRTGMDFNSKAFAWKLSSKKSIGIK